MSATTMIVLLMLALFSILWSGLAPTVSSRVVPSGWKMPDGFSTTISFKINPAIQLWEKTVKPPGWQGGEAIDTTTMLNQVYRTKDAQKLKEMTQVTFTAAYDPNCHNGIKELINNPNSITVIFPNNAKITVYGYLKEAEPSEHTIGEMPLLNCVMIVTNWDPVNWVEAGPVFTASVGTP